jgi:predicted DNA helicase
MRVSDALLSATYERRYESHPDYTELWSIRRELRRLYGLGRHLSATERRNRENQISKLRTRATELEIRIDAALFAGARVVACTLVGSASKVLERKHFSTLFIDEAAQAMEAACWAAILKADRVIFAGDHKQLPPTVKSREAERAGLSRTLMEFVAVRKPSCVQLLTVQYRMHRDIMSFPSQRFYGGRLKAAPEVADRTVLPLEYPLVWIDTTKLGLEEEQNELTQSRLNTTEARLLLQALNDYVAKVGMDRLLAERTDFGIISPYKSQVLLLRRLVRESAELRPLRSAIAVNTVDGFQGQERDVIFISMVRGNDEGRIGFLGDLRRMNVAITRARMKLVILGDSTTLSHTTFYKELFEHVVRHGQVVTLEPETPRSEKQQPEKTNQKNLNPSNLNQENLNQETPVQEGSNQETPETK